MKATATHIPGLNVVRVRAHRGLVAMGTDVRPRPGEHAVRNEDVRAVKSAMRAVVVQWERERARAMGRS